MTEPTDDELFAGRGPAAAPTASDDDLLGERRPGAAGAAFAAFYARHEQAVLAYFARRTRAPELAADLAAETFAQALAHRRRYRPVDGGSAVGWLFGIARHVLARSARRGRVEDRARRRLGLERLALDDEQLAAIERLSDDAGGALERLPADQREAVRARILDEDGYAQIAARLRTSEAVVRKRVSRGLATLRRELAPSGDDASPTAETPRRCEPAPPLPSPCDPQLEETR